MAEDEQLDLIAEVAADPLLAPVAAELRRHARSSIRLRVDQTARRFVGESRVGGRPAAPIGFTWPTRHVDMPTPSLAWIASQYFPPRLLPPDGTSTFQFVAQIDLAAVAPFDAEGLLPHDGVLLFFYDEGYHSDIDPEAGLRPTSWTMKDGEPQFYQRDFGYDQVDQVRVIHVPGDLTLVKNDGGPRPPYASPLVGGQEWTLPSTDAYLFADDSTPPEERDGRIVLSADARSRLANLWYESRANQGINQMLGWEDNGAHGPSLPPEHSRGWSDIPLADRLRETQDARLLLQLSPATYEPTGFEFGRTLYFYVRESDLRRGDFSRAWYDSD
jgi:hypothetical protein